MIKPIRNRVLVLREEHEEKTKGGIIIPGKKEVPTGTGFVIAVGPEIEEPISVGKRIVFRKTDGHDIKVGGKDHVILTDENIMGVFDGE